MLMKARKIVIPIVCIALVAAAGIGIAAATKASTAGAFTDASFVEKKDNLMNYISVSGTVESRDFRQVFSTLNYPVEAVNAEVGDFVRKGDVLCTLNTDSLQNQILQQQAVVDNSSITSQYQLTEAEKNYNNALDDYNSGSNTSIISAEQSLEQAEAALEKAQNDYDNAVEMSGKDKNTQLQSAELSLKNAEAELEKAKENLDKVRKEASEEDYYSIENLKKARDDADEVLKEALGSDSKVRAACEKYQKAYDTYVMFYNDEALIPIDKTIADYLSELRAAEQELASVKEQHAVVNAKKAYEEAVKAYEKAKADIDKAHKNAETSAEDAVSAAEKSIEAAKIQLQSINDNTTDGIKAYKEQLSSARSVYENARENLTLTEKNVQANLASLKSAAERERTLSGLNDSQLIALESLREQLDEAVIKAPCDGTVTFRGASEGELPTGTLFAVEDMTSLKITANLREYDVAYVETGMNVLITTNADDGAEYEGVITKIAPTAAKNPDGSDAGTSLFAVEAAVTSKDTALKIGMSAKMRIITESKDNVLTVPYDCLTSDEDGNDIIYIAEKSETGYTAKAVPVTVGMETDFYAEISGEGISEDTIVINDIQFITDGQTVLINEAELGIAPVSPEGEETE